METARETERFGEVYRHIGIFKESKGPKSRVNLFELDDAKFLQRFKTKVNANLIVITEAANISADDGLDMSYEEFLQTSIAVDHINKEREKAYKKKPKKK